jgi:hypothetical protein
MKCLLILKSDAECLEMINFTSSFRSKKFMLYDVITSVLLYNITYKRFFFKSF